MTNKLPQLSNTVEIVGTLKAMDLKVLEGKVSKKKYVKGKVTVVSKSGNRVHEHVIEIFQMEKNKKGEVTKLFKGIQTMMAEYKSIDTHGEAADRIKVTGEVDINEYYGKDDELKSFNQIKGVFFNRLDETTDQPDKAVASVEVVVKSFSIHADQETGEILHHNVNAFTIGYNEKIIPFKRAIVSDQLADAMQSLYTDGSTGRLTFTINNYVEKVEKEVETQATTTHGFGAESTIEETRVFDKYVSNYEITGGDVPFEEGEGSKALTAEQIADAERKLALTREELKAARATQAPATPQSPAKPTGFGGDIQMPSNLGAPVPPAPTLPNKTELVEDDMPDF